MEDLIFILSGQTDEDDEVSHERTEAEASTLSVDQSLFHTESNDDNYRRYLLDIAKFPLTSKEEEEALVPLAQNGDTQARNRLIEGNLKLVVHIVRRQFSWAFRHRLDLIAAGNIGLMKAVDKCNLSKNARLGTYASWWIRQNIFRWIYKCDGVIYVPTNVKRKILKVGTKRRDFIARFDREPTLEELKDATQYTVSEVKSSLALSFECFGLDGQYDLYNKYSLWSWLRNDNWGFEMQDIYVQRQRDVLSEEVKIKLQEFDARQRKILVKRFGLNRSGREMTLEELSQNLGITRERVRQIQKQSLKDLLTHLESCPAYKGLYGKSQIPNQVKPPALPSSDYMEEPASVRWEVLIIFDELPTPLTMEEIADELKYRFPKIVWPIETVRKLLKSPLFKKGYAEYNGRQKLHYWPTEWELDRHGNEKYERAILLARAKQASGKDSMKDKEVPTNDDMDQETNTKEHELDSLVSFFQL